MKFSRLVSTSVITLLLTSMIACNGLSTSSPASSSEQRAVLVTGGNGGGTTIYLPSQDGKNATMLSSGAGKQCPECEAAAFKYFNTGELDPKCSTCGGTRTAFKLPSPNSGHN